MRPELLTRVDGAKLAPVAVGTLKLTGPQTPESTQGFLDNSLIFTAAELMDLTPDEVYLLSKKVRLLFTRIASQYGVRIVKEDLDMFRDRDTNAIDHELSHFKAIQELRPEVAAQASIGILPVIRHRQLLVGMATMVPQPLIPYTFDEKVRIWMAPRLPSPPDYFQLRDFIRGESANVATEEIESLIKIVEDKKRTQARDDFLKFLKGHFSPSTESGQVI